MNDNNINAGGLIRIDNEIEYRSSTQQAENFLNARLSATISGWNNQMSQQLPDEGVALVSRVYTCIKKDNKPMFVPFWLNMPLSALEDGQTGNKNNKRNENRVDLMMVANKHCGDTDGDTGSAKVTLKVPYASLVNQYGFKDDEIKKMYDHESLRTMHLNPALVNEIRKQAVPHIHRFRKGNTRVIVLIDPRKVFRDMVIAGNRVTTDLNNKPFIVKLHADHQTAIGKYDYIVKCAIVNGKNKKKKNRGEMSAEEAMNNDLANGRI